MIIPILIKKKLYHIKSVPIRCNKEYFKILSIDNIYILHITTHYYIIILKFIKY